MRTVTLRDLDPRDPRQPAASPLWFLCVLIPVAILVYAGSLRHPMLFDDEVVILKNPATKTWRSFGDLFRRQYFQSFQELSYRPVGSFSYLIDHTAFTVLRRWVKEESVYHLTNVLLHAAVGAMVFLFLRSIVPRGWAAPIASLLYVVHPVLTEVVNVAGFREDSLCALFFFLTLALYNAATHNDVRRGWYALSLAAFLLALLSKETALILPILLALQDAMFRLKKGQWRRRVPLYAGVLAVAALYAIVRFWLMRNPQERSVEYAAGSFANTICTMPYVLMRYIRLVLFPVHLNIRYDFAAITTPGDARFVFSVAALLALTAIAVWRLKKDPLVSFGILWFFVALGPASNLLPIGNLMAERFLTLPLLGFCLTVAAAVERAAGRAGRAGGRSAYIAVGIVIACFAVLTAGRTGTVWRGKRALAQQSVIGNPQSGRAWDAVGQVYIEKKGEEDWKRGKRLFERALRLNAQAGRPDSHPVYHLGVCLLGLGEYERARAQFERIKEGDSLYVEAMVRLVQVAGHLGDRRTERNLLRRLLEILPQGHPWRLAAEQRLRYLRGNP